MFPRVCRSSARLGLTPPPQALQNITISRPAPSRYAARRFPAPASPARLASAKNAYSQNIRPNPVMLGGKTFPKGGASDPAVVDTVTVTGADAVPFNVTEPGCDRAGGERGRAATRQVHRLVQAGLNRTFRIVAVNGPMGIGPTAQSCPLPPSSPGQRGKGPLWQWRPAGLRSTASCFD